MPLLLIGNIGLPEILVILVIGLLLFGSRLPEVGRSLGRGLMEFKKGLRGIQDQAFELDRETDRKVDEELRKEEERRRLAAPPPPAPAATPDARPPDPEP